MNAIFTLLNPDNTVTINRPLAHALGLNEAVLYQALLAKCKYYSDNEMLREGEWFYSTVNDLLESTSLSEKQQRLCIDVLAAAGLIECKRMGMPAKRYFRIVDDTELLEKYIRRGEERLAALKRCSAQWEEQAPRGTSSDQTAQQAPPKGQNKNSRRVSACSDERAEHSYKTKDNKSKDINPNQSIPPAAPEASDRIDGIDNPENVNSSDTRGEYRELIRKNIEYYELIESGQPYDAKRVDELVEIMLDAVCAPKDTVRISGSDLPVTMVRSRLLSLDSMHIDYVLTALERSPTKIRNIRAYLLTSLYNAPTTIDSYYYEWAKSDGNVS